MSNPNSTPTLRIEPESRQHITAELARMHCIIDLVRHYLSLASCHTENQASLSGAEDILEGVLDSIERLENDLHNAEWSPLFKPATA